MFPQDTTDNVLNSLSNDNENVQDNYLKTYSFDFDKKDFVVKDGSPLLVNNIEGVKQWITKFLHTDIDTLEIYNGYNFGTSLKKLFGQKYLNNGFAEAELERQIREGFLLCPAISKVTKFKAEKDNQYLKLTIGVLLKSSERIAVVESINL